MSSSAAKANLDLIALRVAPARRPARRRQGQPPDRRKDQAKSDFSTESDVEPPLGLGGESMFPAAASIESPKVDDSSQPAAVSASFRLWHFEAARLQDPNGGNQPSAATRSSSALGT